MNFQEECSYKVIFFLSLKFLIFLSLNKIKETLKIFCGTFNVNAKYPDEDLRPWLFAHTNDQIDIFAIGLQEVVDLNTQSFLLQSDWIERETNWIRSIDNELVNYYRLEKIRMFGLLLLIYVRINNDNSLVNSIYDILKAEVATGIMDTVGNKVCIMKL